MSDCEGPDCTHSSHDRGRGHQPLWVPDFYDFYSDEQVQELRRQFAEIGKRAVVRGPSQFILVSTPAGPQSRFWREVYERARSPEIEEAVSKVVPWYKNTDPTEIRFEK